MLERFILFKVGVGLPGLTRFCLYKEGQHIRFFYFYRFIPNA